MSVALLHVWPGAQKLDGVAPLVEERWLSGPGTMRRRATVATVLVVTISIVVHVGLVATAFLRDAPSAPAPQQEIAVEVVTEVPKAAEKPPEPVKKAEAPTPTPKTAEPPPPDPKPVEKAAAPQPEAVEAALKPSLPPQPKTEPSEPPKSAAELRALQDELAALRAEQAALETQKAAEPVVPTSPASSSGLGPLADSFQAVALPTQSEDGDLPVGYAAIVFSQLAKAKQIGEEMGQPGTAAIVFSVDEKGALASVALATSSGIKTLDDEALSIVHKAAPFPPPPPGAQRSFSANVSFVGRAGP